MADDKPLLLVDGSSYLFRAFNALPDLRTRDDGSLEEVIAHSHEIKGKVGENLRAAVEQLPLSRELTTIRCDVPLDVGIADLSSRRADEAKLRELFTRFEFLPWLEELGVEHADEARATETAPHTVVRDEATLAEFLGKARRASALTLCIHTTRARFMDSTPVGVALDVEGETIYVPVGHDYLNAPPQLA